MTTSENGLVVINGMAVDVPALQQRLVSGLGRGGDPLRAVPHHATACKPCHAMGAH